MNERSLIGLISRGNEQMFDKLFTDWFGALYTYAWSVLRDETIAEEAVQSVFCKIWEKREQLQVHTSIKAYLYGCVYHECVNWLRHEKHIDAHRAYVLRSVGHAAVQDASAKAELKELEIKLKEAMDELPDQCRAIFQLSRFGGLKYQEIAQQLGISVKTVESQVSKALKQLRIKLADFLP